MKQRLVFSLMAVQAIIVIVISISSLHVCSGATVSRNDKKVNVSNHAGNFSEIAQSENIFHYRPKRQLLGYQRLAAGGLLPVLRNRGWSIYGKHPGYGEDGTDTRLFRAGPRRVYDYHHLPSGQCKESQCGYNIRHCPHGCYYNSFQCGSGGARYAVCCC